MMDSPEFFPTLQDIHKQFLKLYPQSSPESWQKVLLLIESYRKARKPELLALDKNPQWFQQSKMVGVTLYVDLFAGDLTALLSKVDYFLDLGITFIHLMPILKTRPGNNDGGYAVADYKAIQPSLGTMADFERVIDRYREKGIAIAIDFVINHTAKEHPWAQAALKGDPEYQAYYMMYDNDEIPNEFNKTVPEVLPDIYPGNFTYYPEIKKYVFKSFSEFQWDLNFANPKVLTELLDIFLFFANQGVSMIRLDAIPFIWKTLGTTCRNLPEVHEFMHFFQLVKQYGCPGVAILGEAIVEPHEIYKYFGSPTKPECDVLYNATLMVNVWEALATQDGRMLKIETDRFPLPKHGTWINYLRCHDDIGWGFNEQFIRDTGRDPFLHKQFLINFYNGSFPGSYARGQNYQENKKTGDARTNGTLSALLGFKYALETGRDEDFQLAFQRVKLVHHLIYSLPGMPLIYSGDEWLQQNDEHHAQKEGKTDGRWLHRPSFNWSHVTSLPATSWERKTYEYLKHLNALKSKDERFSSTTPIQTISFSNHHVFGFIKKLETEKTLYCLFNFANQTVNLFDLEIPQGTYFNILNRQHVNVPQHGFQLAPYESMWLEK